MLCLCVDISPRSTVPASGLKELFKLLVSHDSIPPDIWKIIQLLLRPIILLDLDIVMKRRVHLLLLGRAPFVVLLRVILSSPGVSLLVGTGALDVCGVLILRLAGVLGAADVLGPVVAPLSQSILPPSKWRPNFFKTFLKSRPLLMSVICNVSIGTLTHCCWN